MEVIKKYTSEVKSIVVKGKSIKFDNVGTEALLPIHFELKLDGKGFVKVLDLNIGDVLSNSSTISSIEDKNVAIFISVTNDENGLPVEASLINEGNSIESPNGIVYRIPKNIYKLKVSSNSSHILPYVDEDPLHSELNVKAVKGRVIKFNNSDEEVAIPNYYQVKLSNGKFVNAIELIQGDELSDNSKVVDIEESGVLVYYYTQFDKDSNPISSVLHLRKDQDNEDVIYENNGKVYKIPKGTYKLSPDGSSIEVI